MPPTPFQNRVYAACRLIPAGRVCTYAALGRWIGCRSPRAIGQALKRNPYAPEVPCHRVIASNRTLGGFNGASTGPETVRKRRLLQEEGVHFGEDGRVKSVSLWEFSLAKPPEPL